VARYVAPLPSPEQLANGANRGYDAYDLVGISKFWAMPRDHWAAAAATIHDELYLCSLTPEERKQVDANFARDCGILADADDSEIEEVETACFVAIVLAASPFIDTSADRNTDITRAQGKANMRDAMLYINQQAASIGAFCPYPNV
jgi:hypothetical protein